MTAPFLSLALAVGLASVLGPASAEPPAAGALAGNGAQVAIDVVTLRRMDTNKDGVITRQEFTRRVADEAKWRERDTNRDGVLDTAEQHAGMEVAPRIRN